MRINTLWHRIEYIDRSALCPALTIPVVLAPLMWVGPRMDRLFPGWYSSTWSFALGIVLFLAYMVIVPTLAYSLVHELVRREEMKWRGATASRILSMVRIGLMAGENVGPYAIYTWPFNLPLQYREIEFFESATSTQGTLCKFTRKLLEDVIAEAIGPKIPLVRLGGPELGDTADGFYVGAGIVPSDSPHWREDFILLARSASLIFVIPGWTPAILWEIRHLLNSGRVNRVVLLIPPAISDINKDIAFWAKTVTALREHGLCLPDYAGNGVLFRLRTNGTIAKSCVPKDWSVSSVGTALGSLAAPML